MSQNTHTARDRVYLGKTFLEAERVRASKLRASEKKEIEKRRVALVTWFHR